MTMVERVADAYRGKVMELMYDAPDMLISEVHKHAARAAIEAMREPTEEMIRAGYDWQCTDWPADWSDDGRTPELYTAQHMFPAMIAAALGEP